MELKSPTKLTNDEWRNAEGLQKLLCMLFVFGSPILIACIVLGVMYCTYLLGQWAKTL